MNNSPCVKFSFLCWNVQGLGDVDKCDVVRNTINAVDPVLACIQESKLSELSPPKARSFLPCRLDSFVAKDADGSRGGVVTAWDSRVLMLTSSSSSRFSLCQSDLYDERSFFHDH